MLLTARVAACMVFCALGLACGQGHPGPSHEMDVLDGKLVVTGSSTVAPLVAELAVAFESRHPGVRIDVQSGGSGRGIADTRSGLADIGMASRALVEEEGDLIATQIASDGITLITHKDNPVRSVTRAEVVGIFTGAVTDWSQVGGSAGEIVVVHKAAGRATRDVFLKYFQIDELDIAPDVVVGENEHGIKTVSGNPGAIGYVSAGTAQVDAAAGVPIRTLEVAGLGSTADVIARPLVLLTGDMPSNLARAFIDFACSNDAEPTIRAQHFVPTPHS